MPTIKLLIKAWKLKWRLKRLRVAKENARRAELGLEPIVLFWDRVYDFFIGRPANFIYRAFCPCCIYDPFRHEKRKRRVLARRWWVRLGQSGTLENQLAKAVAGFACGIIVTYVIFGYMIMQLHIRAAYASAFASIVGILLSLGLAFHGPTRCVVILMLPCLFTSRGRSVLISITLVLVISGPLKNATRNALKLGEVVMCGQQKLREQTKRAIQDALSPLQSILGAFKKVLKALKDFAAQVRQSLSKLAKLFKSIADSVKHFFAFLASMVGKCKVKMSQPYEDCKANFDASYDQCMVKLRKYPVRKHAIFKRGFRCDAALNPVHSKLLVELQFNLQPKV